MSIKKAQLNSSIPWSKHRKSKSAAKGFQKKQLKRLQRSWWQMSKPIRRQKDEEWTQKKASRSALLKARGLKRSPPDECPLWNCPRKTRRTDFSTGKTRKRRWRVHPNANFSPISHISSLSRRSRSPIVLSNETN